MISEKYFGIKIDCDECGPIMIITHQPTGLQRLARPVQGESVRNIESRLFRELRSQLFAPEEFTFERGCCNVGQKVGGFYRVTHVPSGKSLSADTITSPPTSNIPEDLLDSLIEVLWKENLRPKR
jgi:hypothetical protein